MNWLAKLYFAEGPGIDKDAARPTGLRLLMSVLGREWWALIQLNVLFIAFSLPLITLPAAWFALMSVTVTMIEDRNVWVFKDFWRAFRSRFVVSSLIGLAAIGAGALGWLAVTSYAAASVDNIAFATPLVIAATVLLVLPVFVSHLLVALADRSGHSLAQTLRAAALGVLARPLPSLVALVFVAFIWLIHIAFYPVTVLLPVLVNFSLTALALSFAAHEGVHFGFSQTPGNPHPDTSGSPNTRSA